MESQRKNQPPSSLKVITKTRAWYQQLLAGGLVVYTRWPKRKVLLVFATQSYPQVGGFGRVGVVRHSSIADDDPATLRPSSLVSDRTKWVSDTWNHCIDNHDRCLIPLRAIDRADSDRKASLLQQPTASQFDLSGVYMYIF